MPSYADALMLSSGNTERRSRRHAITPPPYDYALLPAMLISLYAVYADVAD